MGCWMVGNVCSFFDNCVIVVEMKVVENIMCVVGRIIYCYGVGICVI